MFYYQLYFTGIIHISKQLLYILLEEIVRSRMLVPLLDGDPHSTGDPLVSIS